MWLHNHVTQHRIQLLKSNVHGLCYPQPQASWRTQGEIGRVIIIVRKQFFFAMFSLTLDLPSLQEPQPA